MQVFRDCRIGFIWASLLQFVTVCRKSLLQTVVLHLTELWQQAHSQQLLPQKGPRPQCCFCASDI